MSSRRPMTRAFSANGRLGGINEEDIPLPDVRPDSRNYLTNVRPENRSTLCSVMAQLTEETQPSFDTTLKSRAVSEDSNVKFTCEVSGYPVPELTWYKDDMEMDRYCGLPKYEIFRNGKVHTLQIYNCTVEDAAIYQASAKNPKGIVSCSGVLEVGAMNEFKIHQQFFSKLKHKADAKRKELEESRRREMGKENVQATVPELLHPATPERPPRKRRSPSEPGLRVPVTLRDREPEGKGRSQAEARLQEGARTDVLEQPPTATEIPNGFPADDGMIPSSDLTKATEKEKDNQGRAYVYETVEIVTTTKRRPTKEPLATKRPKISKGVVGGDVSRETAQEQKSKKDEHEEGGMSLAQYLAESLKSQEYENKQNSEQEAMEVDVTVPPPKEKDTENIKILEEVTSNTKTPPSKQPEPPNGQGSLSSVFFSLRDIFFGSKSSDTIKTAENVPQQKPVTAAVKEPPSEPSLPDSKPLDKERGSQAKDSKIPAEEIIQMDTEEPVKPPPRRAGLRSASSRHVAPQKVPADAAKEKWPGLDSHNQGDTVSKSPSSVVEEPGGGRMQTEEGIGALETANLPAEPEPLLSKVADDHMQTERNSASVDKDQVMALHEPEVQVPAVFPGEQVIADTSETDTLSDHDRTDLGEPIHSVQPHSSGSGGISLETKADQHRFSLENMAGQDGAPEPEHNSAADKDLDGKAGDAVKESDKHVEEDRVESGASISQVFSFAIVEDNVEMSDIASLLKAAQREGAKTISESEEEREKDVSNEQITLPPMTVEFRLPNVSQPEESMTDMPEVNIPQSKVPEAVGNLSPHRTSQESTVPEFTQLEATVTSVPKIYIQESSDGQKPPNEKSDLEPLTTFVEKDSDSVNEKISDKGVLSTQVSQQEQEKTEAKEMAAQIHLDKTMAEASIPVINVCLSEDSELWFDPEPHKVKYPTVSEPVVEEPSTGLTFVVPPISIISADDTPEVHNEPNDEVTKIKSVPYFIYDVSEDMGFKRTESPCLEDKEDISPTASVPEETIKDSVGPLVVDEPSEAIVLSQSDIPNMSVPAPETSVTKTPPLITYVDQDQEIPQTKLQTILEPQTFVDKLQKDKSVIESLAGPEQPMLSPTSLRKFAGESVPGLDAPSLITVPAIQVEDYPSEEQLDDENTGADSPPSVPSCETSPRLRRKDSPTLIPSATPEELASGARRKIFLSKSKGDESEGPEKEELQKKRALPQEQEQSYMSPTVPRRSSLLQTHAGQQNPPTWSPQVPRRKATLEVPKRPEELLDDTDTTQTDDKPAGKETLNPFKAPQVIRKIRGEPFPDALGHLKIWCQFFNVLSDSTIKWYRDEVEVAELKRSAGDESQVALAIVQTSSRDCGVYTCTIKNEYGTDTTDFLLSAEILHNFLLREDLEVGEEVEMTPMVFTKGLAHPGYWGDKFFGRIMIQEAHLGEGCAHKACRVKVIYGLEPVFESGSTCIIKARNPIAYSVKDEISLAEKNLDLTKQECKIQNTAREYCKVFAAEARAIENFGMGLEMLPRYLMYRPANTVPYATVEVDVPGVFQKYCTMDASGRLVMRNSSELEQKCCAFQHWIHQWSSGNLLVTQLEGIEARITNVGIATKSKGYQGLPDRYNPQVFEQFVNQHQCNYYCGLLGLRTMKPMDSQPVLAKIKGSRSPLLNRRGGPCASPQLPRKGVHSPQATRKATSPKVPRKSGESGDNGKPAAKPKTAEAPKTVATS